MTEERSKKGKREDKKTKKQNKNKKKPISLNIFILFYQQTSMIVQVSRVKTTRPALTEWMDTTAAAHQVLAGLSAN